jgi:hypothetical protein
MSVGEGMRDEDALPEIPGPTPAKAGGYGRPSLIEIALASIGLAAWLWCAVQVIRPLIA